MHNIFFLVVCSLLNVCFSANVAAEPPSFLRIDYPVDSPVSHMDKGHFNSDEHIDIAVLGTDGTLTVLTGSGSGSVVEKITTSIDTEAETFVVSDLDNDGCTDVICDNQLYLCDGSGSFTFFDELQYPVEYPPQTGDVNGDGLIDLLMIKCDETDEYSRELAVALGSGDGTFGEITFHALPRAIYLSIITTNDFTHDSIPDILIQYYREYDENGPLFKTAAPISFYTIGVLPGNEDGTYGDIIESKGFTVDIINDFNNDNKYDIIGTPFPPVEKFYVLLGNGQGNFDVYWDSPFVETFGTPIYFFLDENGDNILDVGVFEPVSGDIGSIKFFYGLGNGTFSSPEEYSISGFSFTAFEHITHSADLNTDNYDDFIIAPYDSTFISVFLNAGSGTSTENGTRNQLFSLQQNYPNPFNSYTTIPFQIDTESYVSIEIYNLSGQKVRTLVSGQLSPGIHSVVWDGRDDAGERVSSGIFFVRLKAGEHVLARSIVMLK